VGGALISLQKGKPSKLLYAVREFFPLRDLSHPERLLGDMLSALRKVDERISKKGMSPISHVFHIFSSPWIATQTKTVSIERSTEFLLSDRMMKKVLNDSATPIANKLVNVEKRVVQVKLDGREVSNIYKTPVRKVEVALFKSFMPKDVVNKVFDVSRRSFHAKDSRICSFPLASYGVVRDVFHETHDFIFLDVGSELSEISLIRKGVILESASFPIGSNFVIRRVAKDLGTSIAETASIMRTYFDDHMDDSTGRRLNRIIPLVGTEWTDAFKNALSRLSPGALFPNDLFYLINSDISGFFVRELQKARNSKGPFSLTRVSHDTLKSVVSVDKGADRDPFLALAAAFANRVYESGTE
jgi:hypothetical protein